MLLDVIVGEDAAVKVWSRTGMLRSVLVQSSKHPLSLLFLISSRLYFQVAQCMLQHGRLTLTKSSIQLVAH